jgi:cytochrome P450
MSTQIQTHNAPPALLGVMDGLKNVRAFQRDMIGFLQHLVTSKGDISEFQFGPLSMYFVADPAAIQQILVEHANVFYKTKQTKIIFKDILGNGLLVNDGDDWRQQRKLVQPAFHAKRIENYAGAMVQFAERMLTHWQTHTQRDIDADMMKLTLDIVTDTLFGAQLTDQETRDLEQAMTIGQRNVIQMFNSPFQPPAWLPTERNRSGKWATETINRIVMRIIAERRASGDDKGDLLSMLLLSKTDDERNQPSRGMSDKQARDEAITLMLAGHETTANTLTWAWSLLAQYPNVEAKLWAELDTVLKGRAPTLADLANLHYTYAIIKETLRLYPAAYIFSREPQQDVMIGGYRLKKGKTVLISPYVQHHDARFFKDPERFNPDRWLVGENGEDLEKSLPKGVYIPFGGGPRICIGNAFSLMEARLILATIAQRFALRLVPGQQIDIQPQVTLRPKFGMKMNLETR